MTIKAKFGRETLPGGIGGGFPSVLGSIFLFGELKNSFRQITVFPERLTDPNPMSIEFPTSWPRVHTSYTSPKKVAFWRSVTIRTQLNGL